jgi:hypothetical protein
MAETTNIAKIAEKLSSEVFSEFFWRRIGPMNINWPCEKKTAHKAESHPTDAVFYYDEPYSKTRTYINCDLKSYAKATIKASSVLNAVEGLARSVACAEVSATWRDYYIHPQVTPAIAGLLFVYNHDGEYDSDFRTKISGNTSVSGLLPRNSKLVVLGPIDIFWLDNVRIDISILRGQGRLPARNLTRFMYPHLVRHANVQLDEARAATLEMMTGPWLLLQYSEPSDPSKRGVIVYYRRRGEDVGEFLYLIDHLKHYQILTPNTSVTIRTLDTAVNAHANFQKAVQRYGDECGHGSPIALLLEGIIYEKMTQISSQFSEIEIGMADV